MGEGNKGALEFWRQRALRMEREQVEAKVQAARGNGLPERPWEQFLG